MTPEQLHIITPLLRSGLLKRTFSTSEVVELFKESKVKMYDKKLRSKKYLQDLGGKRAGAGRNFEFDAIKVLKLKIQIDNEN